MLRSSENGVRRIRSRNSSHETSAGPPMPHPTESTRSCSSADHRPRCQTVDARPPGPLDDRAGSTLQLLGLGHDPEHAALCLQLGKQLGQPLHAPFQLRVAVARRTVQTRPSKGAFIIGPLDNTPAPAAEMCTVSAIVATDGCS